MEPVVAIAGLLRATPSLGALRYPSPMPHVAVAKHGFAQPAFLLRKTLYLAAFGLGTCACLHAQLDSAITELHSRFENPPDDSRIMMRWWWFGPAATKPELARELKQMKAAGIGGGEIANLYPLSLDDPSARFRNTPFLSDEHLDTLRFA